VEVTCVAAVAATVPKAAGSAIAAARGVGRPARGAGVAREHRRRPLLLMVHGRRHPRHGLLHVLRLRRRRRHVLRPARHCRSASQRQRAHRAASSNASAASKQSTHSRRRGGVRVLRHGWGHGHGHGWRRRRRVDEVRRLRCEAAGRQRHPREERRATVHRHRRGRRLGVGRRQRRRRRRGWGGLCGGWRWRRGGGRLDLLLFFLDGQLVHLALQVTQHLPPQDTPGDGVAALTALTALPLALRAVECVAVTQRHAGRERERERERERGRTSCSCCSRSTWTPARQLCDCTLSSSSLARVLCSCVASSCAALAAAGERRVRGGARFLPQHWPARSPFV
jgi:hypothetical protein